MQYVPERQTDRQTERQTDRETDRQTDRQTDTYKLNNGGFIKHAPYLIMLLRMLYTITSTVCMKCVIPSTIKYKRQF